MGTQQSGRSIVVCNSTNHMLRLDDLLTVAAVPHLLVPIPATIGDLCSVGIEISSEVGELVSRVVGENGIKIKGIFPREKQLVPGLLEILPERKLSTRFRTIVYKVQEDIALSLAEIEYLLGSQAEEKALLFKMADRVRQKLVGDVVDVRAAIEFSNYCTSNCQYCGIRAGNTDLPRYRMSVAEILAAAEQIRASGIRTVILQSGEDPYYTSELVAEIIKLIKQKTKLRITLSIGERSSQAYSEWKRLGANNYLLKFETTNPDIYKLLHPGENLQDRLRHLKEIKDAGYLVGTGNIIGVPGQNLRDIARDVLFMKEAGTGMAGIGPFVPTTNTPLAACPAGSIELTLKTIAVTRLVLKHVFIPSTTALGTLDPAAQRLGLQAGANSLMIVSTPAKYREDYQIYGDKLNIDLAWAKQLISEAGRTLPSYLNDL